MIVLDVATRVRRQFGDDYKTRISDADIFRWINDAQREIAVENRLLQKNVTLPLVGGTPKYAIFADILTLHSITYFGVLLEGYQLKEFQALNEDSNAEVTGIPTCFTVWAGQFWFWPYPPVGQDDHDVVVFYTRTPVDVTALTGAGGAIDLPQMYHNRLTEYCLAMASEMDEDREGYALKMQEFKVGVQNVADDSQMLKQDEYAGITVSPDDWDYSAFGVYL